MPPAGVEQVQVQVGRQVLKQAQALIVKADALGRQVVGTNDGGVASGPAGAQVAPLQDGHLPDPMVAGEIVGGRQAMASGPDYDGVVMGLQPVGATEHAGFRIAPAHSES